MARTVATAAEAPRTPGRADVPEPSGPGTDDVAFHEALRLAIAARGLTLERIVERLRARGIRLSVATLSFWQTGRCRPERAQSLRALAVVEEVLQQPQGALFALLGPPRARGRWAAQGPSGRGRGSGPGRHDVPLSRTWSPEGEDRELWAALDTRWDLDLTRLSSHSRLTVDADRCARSLWTRRLVRAEADGADRWIAVVRVAEFGRRPEIVVPPPLRLGAVVARPEQGLLAAELLFDTALARGETALVEYTVHRTSPGHLVHRLGARLNRASREQLLEVRFDPAARPRDCRAFRSPGLDAPPRERRLRLSSADSVHAVALGAGPGRFGIRWSWE